MTGCRIGKIKMKAGGEIHRLPTIERDQAQKDLVRVSVDTAEMFEPGEIHGFVVFAWSKDGFSSIAYAINHSGFIGSRLLPSYVADTLRDKMIETGDWGT